MVRLAFKSHRLGGKKQVELCEFKDSLFRTPQRAQKGGREHSSTDTLSYQTYLFFPGYKFLLTGPAQ